MNLAIDIFFLIDICVTFNTAILDEYGLVRPAPAAPSPRYAPQREVPLFLPPRPASALRKVQTGPHSRHLVSVHCH